MADAQKRKESTKLKSSELVIVRKDEFPALSENPIDSISSEDYSRVEKLVSWFVLRAPLSEITRLSNPSCIHIFRSAEMPERGSRTEERLKFEKIFLNSEDIDCTNFDFVYRRRAIKSSLADLELASNAEDVFSNPTERAVVFVGKNQEGKDDSCIESVCRHIRNAFAHGRIALKHINDEPFIFLEDGSSPAKVKYEEEKPEGPLLEVRFRMLIKLSTLEDWYGILLSNISD